MEHNINFAIVGCGKIASKHLDPIMSIPGCNLVAVSDVTKEKADDFAEKYGVASYTNYKDMVEQTKCDVVCILTPSGTHAAIASDLVGNCKHIVVEKPMTLKLADADALVESTKVDGVNLYVVHQYRYHPPVRQLHKASSAGRLGNLSLITARVRWCRPQSYYDQANWRGTWSMDGGVIANQACHLVDLIHWIGGPVKSVYATGTRLASDIEAEDTAVATIKFSSGAIGVIEATTAARPHDIECSLSVLGDKGTVEIGGNAANQLKVWAFDETMPEDEEILRTHGASDLAHSKIGHKRFYEDVVSSISNGHAFEMESKEAHNTVVLINAIYESMASGNEVHLPFTPKESLLGAG